MEIAKLFSGWNKPKYSPGNFVLHGKYGGYIEAVLIHENGSVSYYSPSWHGVKNEKELKIGHTDPLLFHERDL